MALPTLMEVWRLALPEGTQLKAGEENLSNYVLWARRMGTRPPLLGGLEAGELALLSLGEAQRVDERLSLSHIITALAELNAIGAGVVGSVSKEAMSRAEEFRVPLFTLPEDCDLREVERAVIRLIVEREAQLDRRGRQIYRQLAQVSMAQKGLDAIVGTLYDLTGKGVFLQDATGLIVAGTWPSIEGGTPLSSGVPRERLHNLISADQGLLTWPSDRKLDDRAPPTTDRPLSGTSLGRCVAGVVLQGQLGGYLSIIGVWKSLDDLDRLAAERGALVCAVELAKQHAVTLAEDRLRGEFLDTLLTTLLPEQSWLGQRARELGYHLAGMQTVLVLHSYDPSDRDRVVRLLRLTARQTDLMVLLSMHPEEIIALCIGEDSAKQLAEHICEEMNSLLVGVGGTSLGVEGARTSYRQAQEALALLRQVPAWGPVLSFSDLGALRLLCGLRGNPELESFCEEQLGDLLTYDRAHGTELVSTLEAFFDHNCNVSRTAEILHLHRNSLVYRLERTAEITGANLQKAEDRFALQMALRTRPLLASTSVCAECTNT